MEQNILLIFSQNSKLFQDFDLIKNYVTKIQDLEGELLRFKSSNGSKSSRFVDCIDSDDDNFCSKKSLFPCTNEYPSDFDTKAVDLSGNL